METSYLVYKLTVGSPSRRTTNRRWKGRGYVLNFGCPIIISGMTEAKVLKFLPRDSYAKHGISRRRVSVSVLHQNG